MLLLGLGMASEGESPDDRTRVKLERKVERRGLRLTRAEDHRAEALEAQQDGGKRAARLLRRWTNRLVGRRARHVRVAETLSAMGEPEIAVEVFFATNRAPDERHWFGTVDAGTLTYGVATVVIPEDHPDGALEKGLVVAELQHLDPDTFHARLAEAADGRGLLTYIHGYNNSFDYAARRAAQVSHDLERPLVPVLFSWPTQGGTWFSTMKYMMDENAAARSSSLFAEMLGGVLEHQEAPTVVMAHSMGSRVVSEALVDLDRQYGFVRPLERVVLAAPDVDATVFARRYAGVATGASGGLTLYCANDDRALKLSRRVHGGYDRLGSCREESLTALRSPDVEVVDASMLYVDLIDHDKVASSPRLLRDLEHVLDGVPADDPKRGLTGRGARFELPP